MGLIGSPIRSILQGQTPAVPGSLAVGQRLLICQQGLDRPSPPGDEGVFHVWSIVLSCGVHWWLFIQIKNIKMILKGKVTCRLHRKSPKKHYRKLFRQKGVNHLFSAAVSLTLPRTDRFFWSSFFDGDMLPFFIIILIFLFAIRHVGGRVWRWDQPLRATRPPFPDNLRDFPMCPLRVLLEAAGFYMLHHVLSSRSASAAGCVRDVPPPRLLHGRLLIRHITGKLRALTVCISKSWATYTF
jgi:hypothetical protein